MAPRFKLPIHVVNYSLALLPVCGYTWYTLKNKPSDEELEKEIRTKYSTEVKASENSREAMKEFFKGIRDPNQMNSKQEEELSKILRAGKDTVKRHYAVDETLYGTEEGSQQAEELQRLAKEESKKKKKRMKQLKKEGKLGEGGGETSIKNNHAEKTSKKSKEPPSSKQVSDSLSSTATNEIEAAMPAKPLFTKEQTSMAAMLAVAVTVGFLLGDRRSR